MAGKEVRYEIRTREGMSYNSYGNITWLSFNGGKSLGIRFVGQSDLQGLNIKMGEHVLCKMEKDISGKHRIVAIAQILGFAKSGRPINFGRSYSGIYGYWTQPDISDAIFDARGEKLKRI